MKDINQRGTEDMKGNNTEAYLARRIMFALIHPDCPIIILDHEASKLGKFVAVRLQRLKGSKDVEIGD